MDWKKEMQDFKKVEQVIEFKKQCGKALQKEFIKRLGIPLIFGPFFLISGIINIINGAGIFSIITTFAVAFVLCFVCYKGYYKIIYKFFKACDNRIEELSGMGI